MKWPHTDAALLVIVPFVLLISSAMILLLKSMKSHEALVLESSSALESHAVDFDELDSEAILDDRGLWKLAKDFGYFWYDFLIGDDIIGFGIVIAGLEATNILVHSGHNGWWAMPLAVTILLPVNLLRVIRK